MHIIPIRGKPVLASHVCACIFRAANGITDILKVPLALSSRGCKSMQSSSWASAPPRKGKSKKGQMTELEKLFWNAILNETGKVRGRMNKSSRLTFFSDNAK